MALITISNGDIPDATPVMYNFNYLAGLITGSSIRVNTYANLRVYAALTPTTPFLGVATDNDLFLLYCGNVARGDGGFVTLVSFGEIT